MLQDLPIDKRLTESVAECLAASFADVHSLPSNELGTLFSSVIANPKERDNVAVFAWHKLHQDEAPEFCRELSRF